MRTTTRTTSRNCAGQLGAAIVQQKKHDALRALELLREQAFEKAPPMPELQLTSAFSKDMDDAGLAL